ncbi:MAG: Glu/Leu/Phe/Val dehydrogenase [Candidatus Omnitrophica bacterium]|nr:Glu/Leu/Phe/Val dehydrogenase [Candidatus Omnitrophota bacterium]
MVILNYENLRKIIDIPEGAKELLEQPEKQQILRLDMVRDNGKVLSTDIYVVYHSTACGPAKGGIRLTSDVTLEETVDLATRMTYKTALFNLDFGGGKSGIRLDPSSLTRRERKDVFREYYHLLKYDLEHNMYIPAPDVNTRATDMAVIFGESHVPHIVTGKPVNVCGLPGREEATGRGGFAATVKALGHFLKKDVRGASVAIQGFGNAGSWVAFFLYEAGAKVVAVSNSKGGIYKKEGLPIPELIKYNEKEGKVQGFPKVKEITNKGLLELEDIDVLIPAARENQITGDIDVNAKIIIEVANGPTTPEGDKRCNANKVKIIPDVLGSGGGVIASHDEYEKGRSASLIEREDTFKTIDRLISRAFDEVVALAEKNKISYRDAALGVSVNRVVTAMKSRGWI